MDKVEVKKICISLLIGAALTWATVWVFMRKDKQPYQPLITDDNVNTALDAYSQAVDDGQPMAVLNEINKEMETDYGVRVYRRKTDGVFVATDLSGKEVGERS